LAVGGVHATDPIFGGESELSRWRTVMWLMLLIVGSLAVAVGTAATSVAPTATADPVWPVAGAESAADTIADLEGQGYIVAINWTRGYPNTPLSRCTVTSINNPDRSANSGPPESTTVYVDVSCPHEDNDWGWGVGIGFW
jgi:hypothetical protein